MPAPVRDTHRLRLTANSKVTEQDEQVADTLERLVAHQCLTEAL